MRQTLGFGFSEDVYDRAMQVGLRGEHPLEGQKVSELKYKDLRIPINSIGKVPISQCRRRVTFVYICALESLMRPPDINFQHREMMH